MKSLLIAALIFNSLVAFAEPKPATSSPESVEAAVRRVKAPITSNEDFSYIDAEAAKLFTMMKHKGYKGIIDRPYGAHEVTRKSDLYVLNLKKAPFPEDFCPLLLEKVFGLEKSEIGEKSTAVIRGIALKSEDLGKKGVLCDAVVEDRNKGSYSPLQHMVARFTGEHVYIFIAKVPLHYKDVAFTDLIDFARGIKPRAQ